MNEQAGKGRLELEVKDFGPIVKAKVDLRPLTVFVGPSNTGKSYLAVLIYALHQFLGGFAGRRFHRSFSLRYGRANQELSEESVGTLLEIAKYSTGVSGIRDQDSIVLPPQIAEVLRIRFDESADALSSEISRCFGFGKSRTLIRKGSKNTSRIVMKQQIFKQVDPLEHTVTLAKKLKFRTTIPAEASIPLGFGGRGGIRRNTLHIYRRGLFDERDRKFAAMDILSEIGRLVIPSLFSPLYLPAYYLPASRTGIMQAHNVVVSSLIAMASTTGIRPTDQTPMLSGVLADFLEQLIEIAPPVRTARNATRDFGRGIEEAILGGTISIDRSTQKNYPRFVYRPDGWKNDLALANVSSMVSELAPVVLYLRHIIEPNSVLIVEEPESHLHPEMQVNFTRQLAALVEKGIRVVITTHSEWVLEALANIVRRSELSDKRNKSGDEIALCPNQVGVWLFEPKLRPKGSIVKEIGLEDTGLYPSGYDEVASKLHNEWANISSCIGADS